MRDWESPSRSIIYPHFTDKDMGPLKELPFPRSYKLVAETWLDLSVPDSCFFKGDSTIVLFGCPGNIWLTDPYYYYY